MNPVIKNNFTVISLSFSYKSIVKLNGKTFGSHNMTMLYPNLFYIKACYKKTALLAHWIRISEILIWDRKSYLTHAILPMMSSNVIM